MTCPSCQHANPPESNFCLGCGARLALTCSSCSTALPAGSRFCNKCGTPVAAEPSAQPRFTSPEAYTPKHLAEKILTSKSALEGERKQVTVLFADLKGSMELLADRDPEEARQILDPVLERMMEAVHRYEGTVNQVMGDGIMALFGAPLAHEDHAVRACYAALAMQGRVKRYAEDASRAHSVNLQIRVGLNSGEVVVRAIGSDLHMDYTAVGQTTHLAARMEQLSDPGATLLTSATLRLAEGYVEVKARGRVPVKGLAKPVEVYELVGAEVGRLGLRGAVARGLSRFVGRDGEIDQLRQALERAEAGHGQIVAIVGEPGVGKSRLYWEFTRSHRDQGWLVLESGCVSYGKATPYLPAVDLLKAYFQIDRRDNPLGIREKVVSKVLSLDRLLGPSLPPLLALLDAPVDDPAWERLEPALRRQRTLGGIERLLLRECQVQPVMVLLEDLHWIDQETQALLDGLIESLPTARLLVLASYRPEYQHGWGGKTYYRQLRIDPLRAATVDDLLTNLLGSNASLEPLRRTLIARTEGNPLFLEESVRALVETGALVGARGAYEAATGARAIEVPATVQAILAARVDRVSPEDKELLQAASVIGMDVPLDVLHAIADLPDEACHQGLIRLQAAEFLYEARLFPNVEYTFKHALTHDVAYGGILQERRRRLHARIVEAIERLYADRLDAYSDRLANHAAHGGLWEKAVRYFRRAGRSAFQQSANRQSVHYFQQALAALEHLPPSPQLTEQAIDLRLNLRPALFPLGEVQQIHGYLIEAEALARTLGDPRRIARVSTALSNSLWAACRLRDAQAFGEQAKEAALRVGDEVLAVETRYVLGGISQAAGDYEHGHRVLLENIQAIDEQSRAKAPATETSFVGVMSRAWLLVGSADTGMFAEGITHGTEAIRIGRTIDRPYGLALALWSLGNLLLVKGDLISAAAILDEGRSVCQRRDVGAVASRMHCTLAHVHAQSGRLSEAASLLDAGLQLLESEPSALFVSLVQYHVGDTYLLLGQRQHARATAERALTQGWTDERRALKAWMLHLSAKLGDDAPSERQFGDALKVSENLRLRPLIAHCHLGLGKLYRRTGDRKQAQEHLTIATTMYREMDMRFWLEQAEAEMKELA